MAAESSTPAKYTKGFISRSKSVRCATPERKMELFRRELCDLGLSDKLIVDTIELTYN